MFLKDLYQDRKTEFNSGLSPSESEKSRLFEDILDSGTGIRLRVTGRSMSPFLTGGEILTIRKVPFSSLQRGDLIFFRNAYGCLVLHRLLKKMKSDEGRLLFQTKGDALPTYDEPVRDNKILGKVCRIERTGRERVLRHINMESTLLKNINYLIGTIGIIESTAYRALSWLFRRKGNREKQRIAG